MAVVHLGRALQWDGPVSARKRWAVGFFEAVGFLDFLLGQGSSSRPTICLNGGTGGEHEIRVSGTTYYQAAAERVVKRNREENLRINFLARLVPEPDNPSDPNAIAVYGEGRQIGHLSREDAARYCSAITRLAASFKVTTFATINAGHHGGSTWDIGLRLPPPEKIWTAAPTARLQ